MNQDESISNSLTSGGRSGRNFLSGRNKSTPRNSQASTASTKSTNAFFRNFFAQRNTDYRSDVPSGQYEYSQGTTPRTTGAAVRRPSSGRSSPPPDPSELLDESTTSCCACCHPSPRFLHVLSLIIGSRPWHIIIGFNTILLLFGSEIQELWIPPAADLAMDILYLLTLAVFTMDIVMRCYLEPSYLTVPKCRNKDAAQNSAWGRCQLGSFLFWCDLLSTATLLYNVSFINKPRFATKEIDIVLNAIGIPVSDWWEFIVSVTTISQGQKGSHYAISLLHHID